jgi:hypothetical protein
MTEREIQEAILQICKVAGHDSDINMAGFLALCDKLKELGVAAERERLQENIRTMCDMYTTASSQRDELMDQQRAQVAALRGRIQ